MRDSCVAITSKIIYYQPKCLILVEWAVHHLSNSILYLLWHLVIDELFVALTSEGQLLHPEVS